jgi:hypothetical protein
MVLRAICSLIILAGALFPVNARGSEMIFSKDDVGQLWLQIMGRIEDGDDVKFKIMLMDAINRGEQIANVSIYSPGGRAVPTIKIGRYIRTMHLSTVAPQLVPLLRRHTCSIHTLSGRTTFIHYDPWSNRGDPRCICENECFLIWAAGTARLGNAMQIYRVSRQRDDDAELLGSQTRDVHANSQEVIGDYLHEMGIPSAIVARMFSSTSDKREYLTKEERDMLADRTRLLWLEELLSARCRHYAATSPAALACEKAVIRDLYWKGAQQLLSRYD